MSSYVRQDKMSIIALLNDESEPSIQLSASRTPSPRQGPLSSCYGQQERFGCQRQRGYTCQVAHPTRSCQYRRQTDSSLSSSPQLHWPRNPVPPSIIEGYLSRNSVTLSPNAQHAIGPEWSQRSDLQSSQTQSKKRESRPPYTIEEQLFIWYCRTDLMMCWDDIYQAYNNQGFPPRDKAGLQCRFYRTIGHWKVPQVRSQIKCLKDGNKNMIGLHGVVQRTSRRFPWMKPEHQTELPLEEFRDAHSPPPPAKDGSNEAEPRHECHSRDCDQGCSRDVAMIDSAPHL